MRFQPNSEYMQGSPVRVFMDGEELNPPLGPHTTRVVYDPMSMAYEVYIDQPAKTLAQGMRDMIAYNRAVIEVPR